MSNKCKFLAEKAIEGIFRETFRKLICESIELHYTYLKVEISIFAFSEGICLRDKMDSDVQELDYQRLNELIYDEEKIVTILSVAADLKIPPLQARRLINMFLKDHQKLKPNELHITYLLSGLLNNEKGSAIYLVKEEELEEKKSLFDTITTEFFYSIQKGRDIDFNLIASTSTINEKSVNLVMSKNCIKRNIQKPIVATPASASIGIQEDNRTLKSLSNSQRSQKQAKAKNGGITNFFAKAPTKIKTNNDQKEIIPVVIDSNININNTKTEVVKEQNSSEEEITNSGNELVNMKHKMTDNETSNNEKMETDNHTPHSGSKKNQKLVNNKKRKNEGKHTAPNKKRKRIQEICDSDSSDMFDDNENEDSKDIIEMSDEEPVHTTKSVLPPKNKTRKVVDKTYVDEEGFIVTSTEYIYESASDDDEKDIPPAKIEEKSAILSETKNHNETKQTANKGRKNKKQNNCKQPTLMSFFKKS